jgi:hypothetical protein
MSVGRWIAVALITAVLATCGGIDRAVASNPLLAFEPRSPLEQEADDRAVDASDDDRVPYVAGIVGSSFATDDGDFGAARLLAGNAAIGVSVPRPLGAVRLEVEGRQRTALSGTRPIAQTSGGPADGEPATVSVDGEWTTLANVWRDVALSDHAAIYAGAGAGVGGYRETTASDAAEVSSRVTDVAWQVGGGATYAITDRVTLDAGYRYYGVGAGGGDQSRDPAGEVVFAVRIADPFRSWLGR